MHPIPFNQSGQQIYFFTIRLSIFRGRKLHRFLLYVTFLLVTSSISSAFGAVDNGRWLSIGTTKSKTEIFIDPKSIQFFPSKIGRDFPITKVWVLFDYERDLTEKNRESKQQIAIDCEGRTFTVLSVNDFDPQGKITRSKNLATNDYSSNYEPIPPGSIV